MFAFAPSELIAFGVSIGAALTVLVLLAMGRLR